MWRLTELSTQVQGRSPYVVFDPRASRTEHAGAPHADSGVVALPPAAYISDLSMVENFPFVVN